MSTRLHCNGCSHDYDTILPEDELDAAVCPRCGSFGSSVPADQEAMTETLEEAFTSPPPVAPVAESRPVEKQLEAPREKHEGQQGTHPRETRVAGNVEGRFPRQVTRKGLLIAGGILVLLIIAGGITWTIVRSPGSSSTEGGVDVVIEKEAPQAPEKKPEEEKQVSQAPQKPAPAPAPVQKKTPAKTPKVQTPREPWKYRVEAPAPQAAPPRTPAPQAQARGNIIGDLLGTFTGPAPDVTPPSDDPRDTGR